MITEFDWHEANEILKKCSYLCFEHLHLFLIEILTENGDSETVKKNTPIWDNIQSVIIAIIYFLNLKKF
ncbi:hypothetical protein DERP_009558 [Dermatophagoides pteronyssinus]|uniref:Uncharacterized protein n=1 Tax=Dermatophagoides pteronyssinus TaxID=6956 RepID=A0ABQ8JAW5_DERPT|nr:hypothetical protein DERP_009558 [Dermatophagoides pteronyssinus]